MREYKFRLVSEPELLLKLVEFSLVLIKVFHFWIIIVIFLIDVCKGFSS